VNWYFQSGGYSRPTHNSRNMPFEIPARLFKAVSERASRLTTSEIRRCSFQEALTQLLRNDAEDEL